MENTLNENHQEVLDNIFGDAEEISVTADAPVEEKTDVVEDTPVEEPESLDDIYEEEEEEEPTQVVEKKKPGRRSKTETYTREEALRAAAKRFGEQFGVTDEQVPFDELDEDGVVDFIDQLAEQLRENTYNNVKNSDEITRNLFDYKEKGGDPLELLQLYKQQDEVEKMEITDQRGQRKVVEKYYKEVLGWEEDEIDDHVESLAATEKLEKEAQRLKGKFDAHYENELKLKQDRQQKVQQREALLLQQRQEAFSKALDGNKVSKKEADGLYKIAFGKGQLPDGRVMDMIDYEIAKIQRDPDKFLDLVRFIHNKEEYLKTISQVKINDENNKSFKKLAMVSGRKTEAVPTNENKTQGFVFNI